MVGPLIDLFSAMLGRVIYSTNLVEGAFPLRSRAHNQLDCIRKKCVTL